MVVNAAQQDPCLPARPGRGWGDVDVDAAHREDAPLGEVEMTQPGLFGEGANGPKVVPVDDGMTIGDVVARRLCGAAGLVGLVGVGAEGVGVG